MEQIGAASGLLIDALILSCLVVAICVGTALLWQIVTLRRERFKFDQMTKALTTQISIFQSALTGGRDDIEVKITRLNKALSQARDTVDELHALIDRAENIKQAAPAPQQQSRAQAKPAPAPVVEERRPLFAIVDPEFTPEVKEDSAPAVDNYGDLSPEDRVELSQLGTQAEQALMAALKRAGRR